MQLTDVIAENTKKKANLLKWLSDMLAINISLGLNDNEFSIGYMHSYLKDDQIEDQSGLLYSSSEVSRNKKLAAIFVCLSIIAFSVSYGPSAYYAASGLLGVDNTSENILETAKAGEEKVKADIFQINIL